MAHRFKTLVVGVLSGFMGRGIAIFSPLLVTGPMLAHLGDHLFGTWLTAISIAMMVTFLGSGVNNALLTRLSESLGKDDLDRAKVQLGQGYLLSGSITAGLFAALVFVTYVAKAVAQIDPSGVANMRGAVLMIVLSALFLSFTTQILGHLLQAEKKFFRSQLFQSTGSLVALVTALLGIRNDLDPILVVALYSLSPVCVQVLWSILYFTFNYRLRPVFEPDSFRQSMTMFRLGSEFFVVSILVTLSMNIDNSIIAIGRGPGAVAEFGVPMRLGAVLMLIVATCFTPLWSLFGEALARKDTDWIVRTTRWFGAGCVAFVFVLGVGMVVLADEIMMLWVGRTFDHQTEILAGAVALALVVSMTSPYSMFLNAAGKARQQIFPWALFLFVSVALKYGATALGATWWIPWISAACYLCLISPVVIWHSNLQINLLSKPKSKNG